MFGTIVAGSKGSGGANFGANMAQTSPRRCLAALVVERAWLRPYRNSNNSARSHSSTVLRKPSVSKLPIAARLADLVALDKVVIRVPSRLLQSIVGVILEPSAKLFRELRHGSREQGLCQI